MRLPAINEIPASVVHTDAFRGYHHSLAIRDDEFFDMENLSGDEYPLLAPRKPRRLRQSFRKPHGLHAHEKLCWVDGTNLYYDGVAKGTVADSDKQFASMGAYVIIWPDKVLLDTQDMSIKQLALWASTTLVEFQGEKKISLQVKDFDKWIVHKGDVVKVFYIATNPGDTGPLTSRYAFDAEILEIVNTTIYVPYDSTFQRLYEEDTGN